MRLGINDFLSFQKGFAEDSQLDEIQQFFEQYGKVGMSPLAHALDDPSLSRLDTVHSDAQDQPSRQKV